MAGSVKHSNGLHAEINVAPMVDVMLVLLVIFMVTTPLIESQKEQRQVELNLPVTRNNSNVIDPAHTDKTILVISRDLKLSLGDVIITDCSSHLQGTQPNRFEPCFDEIELKLGQNQKLKEQGEAYILADTEIPYGFVVGSMARIKNAGVSKIGMVTNPEYLLKPDTK